MTTVAPPSENNILYSENKGEIGLRDHSISDMNISKPNVVTLNRNFKIKTKEEGRGGNREKFGSFERPKDKCTAYQVFLFSIGILHTM